jgi:hypothetical protein
MAQIVHYWDNDVAYSEGPFVICNAMWNGWRVEVELKGHHCPVLPDISIYPVMKKLGLNGKTLDQDKAARVCDRLNEMVREGCIALVGNAWVLVLDKGRLGRSEVWR